jgi:hypothetical protein
MRSASMRAKTGPQLRARARADVDPDRAPVHGDRELLPGQVGRADVRPGADVAEAHGVRRRAEVERAPVEDAVHRPDERAPVGGDRRERQQPHPAQARGDLLGVEPPLRRDDPAQVGAGRRVAAVEEVLQRREIGRRLVHGGH